MNLVKTFQKRSLLLVISVISIVAVLLAVRLFYLMVPGSGALSAAAQELHERERAIKAERGKIYDRNGVVLADNMPVCTISVIHNQITDAEQVIRVLCEELGLSEAYVRKRVEKYSSIETIKTNVEKEIADRIRAYELDGVMVDEDYRRYYPYNSLASKVLGFTGSDNQGILGLEVKYDFWLRGENGKILTLATAHGVEIPDAAENMVTPIAGNSIRTSLDVVIQSYAEQTAMKVLEAKGAKSVSIIVMNPQNGELYAMVNVPEYDLNHPYDLTEIYTAPYTEAELTQEKKTELLNQMWRNSCISDTYEPGSAFKIITATAALEHGVLEVKDSFHCPGYKIVADRRIRCHKTTGHGTQSFVEAIMNSCNPAFMEIGARTGIEQMYETFRLLGLFQKTGIDLPGEASSIMHKTEAVGEVELATISFGQSFQITPLQLMSAVSTVINGGTRVTPHFVTEIVNNAGVTIKTIDGCGETGVVSKETSEIMKMVLEQVVSEGSGSNAYLEGMSIGGKTATSEKLPRRSGKYIASFLGFAPAENPEVIAMVIIDEPQGLYYGGTIAAPVMAEVFEMVLPYLGILPDDTNFMVAE
ncbi:MAG: peptidoglycan glycosyltransferase [Lachnospiraceae bacterium]|nr:peptidoglycan glycosyltransferase [Lachnospiraceae bacterium]